MARQTTTLLVLVTALVALAAGQECRVSVPFSTSLVGQRFSRTEDCFRPNDRTVIDIFEKNFVFTPAEPTSRFGDGFEISNNCPEKYVFRFRPNRQVPVVVYFPAITNDDKPFISAEVSEKFCKEEQHKIRERYFPTGKTRNRFIESVRAIVKGTTEIRDLVCDSTDGDGSFVRPEVDGIITYLLGVGYDYDFCAESA